MAARERGTRRMGLGMTGLADSLIMLGLHYAHDAARQQAAQVMAQICHTAYRTSIDLAREKGTFPCFDKTAYLNSPFVQSLPTDIQQGIAQTGIRNSHLTAIAPTGTISLLAGNVSSGIEPVEWSFLQRDLVDETVQLFGNATFAGGQQASIEMVLVQVDGEWLVAGFHVT